VTSLILTISRSYSNYQFAKFCWKSVVQPQLHANGDGISENTITCWLLDNDPQSRVNAGVFDRLLRHVDRISKDTKEAQQKGNKQMDTRYDIRLAIDVDRVILCFGSAEDIVLYQHLDNGQAESDRVNGIHFRATFSIYYLNTRHDQMESLVEPYPCFGHLEYKTFLRENLVNTGGDSESKWL